MCSPDGGIREGRCRGYRGWGSRGREQAVQEIVLGIGVIKNSMKVFYSLIKSCLEAEFSFPRLAGENPQSAHSDRDFTKYPGRWLPENCS